MLQKEKQLLISEIAELLDDGKKKVCEIKIYDNEISIISKGRVFLKEYLDITKLVINKRSGKVRKLLINTTVLLVSFSVNGESSPEIVFTENELRMLLKKVDNHKSLIKDQEKFKDEFIKNHRLLIDYYNNTIIDMKLLQDKHLKPKINSSVFLYIVKDMYSEIGDTKTIGKIEEKFVNGDYVKRLFDETIDYSLLTNDGIRTDFYGVRMYIEGMLKTLDQDMVLLSSRLSGSDDVLFNNSEVFEDDEFSFFAKDYMGFHFTYLNAMAFIRHIILVRNKESFTNNKELNQMFVNMLRESNLNSIYIAEKLYSMYLSFYRDTFKESISQQDFFSLIHSLKNEYEDLDITVLLGKENINELKNRIELISDSDDLETYNKMINEIISFLLNANLGDIIRDSRDSVEIKKAYILVYYYYVMEVCDIVPAIVFNRLIDDNYWENIDLLCVNFTKKSLNEEKDRLLNGDLVVERRMLEDKYSFENIQSGYDFEDYLEALFSKMGYIVTTTKKSSDQGGDLVLRKNGETIVVQAKYYSSPVGNKAVQEVVSSMPYYGADKGVVVTNNRFTNSAVDLASANCISLVDGDNLGRIRDAILNNANPIFVD